MRRSSRHASLLGLAVTVLAGCGDPAPDPTCAIGAYTSGFEPFVDGQDVELISGIQGGYHIDLAFLGIDLDPGGALLSVEGAFADSDQTVAVPVTRILSAGEVVATDDGWVREGERLIMATSDPSDVADQDVRVAARIEESGGASAVCEVVVHVVDTVDELALPPTP